jgi:hypothetical protein
MPDAPSLRLEPGECVTLSPTSDRFKAAYQQSVPRRAEEVRAALGLSDTATKALQEQACCPPAPALVPRPEDLDSPDAEIRTAARRTAYNGLQAYVRSPTPGAFDYLKPALDRYLDISKAVINSVLFSDIEVAEGATLTISKNTHVVYANRVIIHTSGRIVCQGAKTFKITSLEGVRPILPIGVSSSVAVALGH